MPQMYCPQCGRELELDSGEIRFCRYCGFSLVDTKEALHGFSEPKRTGFTIVTWAYALLLGVTLLLHGQYVSLDKSWVYWLSTILIVISVSFFSSAAFAALKPALFTKSKRHDQAKPGAQDTKASAFGHHETRRTSLPSPAEVPVTNLSNPGGRNEKVREPRSIVEGTTKSLNDRSHSG